MNFPPRETKLDIVASKTYAFTLNPNDESQGFDMATPEARWAYVTDKIIRCFDCVRSFDFEFYFEVSTPDHYNCKTKSRVHIHGFINIYDLPRFLLYEINKLSDWSDIKIKELSSEDGYRQYCMKQQVQLGTLHPIYYSTQMKEFQREQKKKQETEQIKKRFKLL